MKKPLLIIVHPGSACGSADENLGRDTAAMLRLDMQMLVEGWDGGVVVIDGELSDELSSNWRREYNEWGAVITGALTRAKDKGFISRRIMGDDDNKFNQEDAIKGIVREHGLTDNNSAITLTWAWIQSSDGGGCVTSVEEALAEIGISSVIEDAMDLDYEGDAADDDNEFLEEEDSLPRLKL
jgi:hypothetical protein